MYTGTQIKRIMKKLSKEKGISSPLLLQNYMLERLLERISVSRYKDNFILKGGLLIASIIGVSRRSTMDMDVTLKRMPLSKERLYEIFAEICQIQLNDNVVFVLENIKMIRKEDQYGGYRLMFTANMPPMKNQLKVDVTTGDIIIPKEMEYKYSLLLEKRNINVLAYNLETVLAEKIEAILSRGTSSTRVRDYYDVYVIHKLKYGEINKKRLAQLLLAVSAKRKSLAKIKENKCLIDKFKTNVFLLEQWRKEQNETDYLKSVSFEETCCSLSSVISDLDSYL